MPGLEVWPWLWNQPLEQEIVAAAWDRATRFLFPPAAATASGIAAHPPHAGCMATGSGDVSLCTGAGFGRGFHKRVFHFLWK